MPAPASRAARPILVPLASGRYSVRFRGLVVLSRVSLAAAEIFAAGFDGGSVREYRPVAGLSHSARCRAYRARLAAALAASAPAPVALPVAAPLPRWSLARVLAACVALVLVLAPLPAGSAPLALARDAVVSLALAPGWFRPALAAALVPLVRAPAPLRASRPGRPAAAPLV